MNPIYIPKYSSIYTFFNYTVKTHGLKAMWQGLSATIIRNIPANSLFFPGMQDLY